MDESFFLENIGKKQNYLQDEHKKVLDVIYKNAVEGDYVKDFGFNTKTCQCMTFAEIKDETDLSLQVVITCLSDLESMGFIRNVMLNPNKEYSYAMTWLGLKISEDWNSEKLINNDKEKTLYDSSNKHTKEGVEIRNKSIIKMDK